MSSTDSQRGVDYDSYMAGYAAGQERRHAAGIGFGFLIGLLTGAVGVGLFLWRIVL